MRVAMAVCVALLAAGCSDPRLNAGLSLGTDGLTVRPSVSADVGGLNVEVSP
jgi:hypothetical protein